MRHLAAPLALVLALPALGQTRSASGTRTNKVAFYPLNRSGTDLCTEWSTTITGTNAWCLKPDGTSMSGGLTLTATGSPSTQDAPFYPFGADKGPGVAKRYTTADTYTTASVAGAPGDQTVCAVVEYDVTNPAPANDMLVHGSGVGAASTFSIYIGNVTPSGITANISDGTVTTQLTASIQPISRGWHFVCAAYQSAGSGGSTFNLYLDAAQVATSSTAVGPPNASSFAWNATGQSGRRLVGQTRNAFFVPTYLSAATIAQMTRTVFGMRGLTNLPVAVTDTPAYESAITFTRASAARFVVPSTTGDSVVVVGAGVGRVTPTGLAVESTATNQLLRSEQFDNAAWVKENGGGSAPPTVTADYAVAPDGATTADRVQFGATSGGAQFSDLYASFTASSAANPLTCSVFVRGTSGGGTTDLCLNQGSAWTCSACDFTTAWKRCSLSVTPGAVSTTHYCKLGNNSNQNGSITRAASDVVAWGLVGEEAVAVSGYIPTTTTTVNRPAEVATASISPSVAPACLAGTWNTSSATRAAFPNRWAALSTNCTTTATLDAYAAGPAPNVLICLWYQGTQRQGSSTSNFITANSTLRLRCQNTATTNIATCSGTTCENTAVAAFTPAAMSTLYIGSYCGVGYEGNGTFQGVTYGPNSGDCP